MLDLAGTEWPDLPNAEVVNASIYAARGRVNGYPDRLATRLRRRLAGRHGVEPEQIAVGNGAAELLQTAAHVLLEPGDELVTPWPSYPLYPLMAQRAGGRPVAVELSTGGVDPEAVLAAMTDRTRVVTICNPNDPTGTYLEASRLAELLAALPERVHVLLDEAWRSSRTSRTATPGSRSSRPSHGCSCFGASRRSTACPGCGRATWSAHRRPAACSMPWRRRSGSTRSARPRPSRRSRSATVRSTGARARRALVLDGRTRLLNALASMPVDAPPSQANFVWLRAARLSGAELAARLEEAKVRVAPGGPLGDDDHVRAAIRGGAATGRLLAALAEAIET